MNMQGIPPNDALNDLVNRPKSSILHSWSLGFQTLGVLLIGFLCAPFFLYQYVGPWPTIVIEAAWLVVLGLFVRWLRKKKSRRVT